MNMKTSVLYAICIFLACLLITQAAPSPVPGAYGPAPERQSVNNLDRMISRCFQSICKQWMTECHWFCDAVNTKSKSRCMDCLSLRGQHCLPCFEL
uniref:Conotoxin n=1 Tax=Panagrellus redivivus TaxID=6233 RepID=A0A7E4VCR0_PANRE